MILTLEAMEMRNFQIILYFSRAVAQSYVMIFNAL